MPALKNIRHEKFCQGTVSGLSQTKAYTGAGYSERGAKQSAARLLADADVRSRIAELRDEIESRCVRLQITERNGRLLALQERWDALLEAKAALAREDYAAAMKTGLVTRKKRSVRDGKDSYLVVDEYEINSALIECLNSVEKRAAIETGQEVDRADIKLRGGVNDQAEILRKTFTWEELRAMQDRMQATIDAEQGKSTPPANIVDVKPILEADDKHQTTAPGTATGEGKRPSWRD